MYYQYIMGDILNVLITGGASNIALNVALKLARNNLVYLTVHTNSQVKNLKEKIKNGNIIIFKLDIRNSLDYLKINNIHIDLFIANAAICYGGSVLAISNNVLKDNFETNVFANFALIKYVYSKMANGKIFIMSSLVSMLPIVMMDCYVSSKAAISMLTLCLQKELKIISSKVKITLIEPGAFYTGFNQVMIDNKEIYLNKDSKFYQYYNVFDKRQRKIFKLIECRNINKISNKIVKQAYKRKPKSKIRAPFLQIFLVKVYNIFLR